MIDNPVITEPFINLDSIEDEYIKEVLEDFWICCVSRETSLMARKEVLTGKAKFGITGDGKEVPQVAMARAFKKGDWRSGYYRDQTFMMALGLSTVEDFFAQLYADPDNDPFSGGRQMNGHYSSQTIDPLTGAWKNHKEMYNVSADISCTAGQMARALGLALASKKYRALSDLPANQFSEKGQEVSFCTIGDASTSEGIFWESMNAACVLRVPLAVSVWDDGYGISVPKKYQTTKESISKALAGFKYKEKEGGMRIYRAKGWDYSTLREMYKQAIELMRQTHVPALLHIEELTQPQGHSTSGSHERYKDKKRLEWERKYDCISKMSQWMIKSGIASKEEIYEMQIKAKKHVKACRDRAWQAYSQPSKSEVKVVQALYKDLIVQGANRKPLEELSKELGRVINPVVSEIYQNAKHAYYTLIGHESAAKTQLKVWLEGIREKADEDYHTNLYSNSDQSALKIPVVHPTFSPNSPMKNGYEILNAFFDKMLARHPELIAFGEDVGHIGDVNQGFAGLQEAYGKERVFDTGIREWSIMGQAIGLGMRGLRPIAEIQYLDYLIYGLEPLNDDLATLRYRSDGQQKAPVIIRTRGHRLEGIWHSGSPLGMMINALRGMYLIVPRNMTQAAGFYNTLLQSDDPAIVVECLNGYRRKEKMPNNIGDYSLPLGLPEVLHTGEDVTLVTYGSCVRVAEDGMAILRKYGISVELIDVQTLLPFDLEHQIVESIKKTNRVVFLDEDVPGGATAYMMQEVLEKQNAYQYLDSPPITLTAHQHRPPYGSDGDYFTKPNPEDVFETIYGMMHEVEPSRFPALFS